jgi:Nucleotidyltransferase/DNA polymerase involved in DNA repair
MERIIMHIDVNNAFLSWTAIELLKDGYPVDIRTIESVIGGDESTRHGIVLAKSPIAKNRGVKTAETLRDARRKCNNLKTFSPNYNWYKKMSDLVFDKISGYTPDIEVLSIDECFLDYTPVYELYGDPIKFAHDLKEEIFKSFGFTVNIGIANNKLCAKMASDFEKPDKVHTLFKHEIEKKMYPLSIDQLYGIGKKSAVKLIELGINKIGDLANASQNDLKKYFKKQTKTIIEKAQGIDNSPVIFEIETRKGISNSSTFSYNLTKLETIFKSLQALVENSCNNLRKDERYAHVIGVTIKDKFFKTYSHQRKLINATNSTEEIYEIVKELFLEMWDEDPIRLLGVSLNKLIEVPTRQLSLFEEADKVDKNTSLDKTVDKLKTQYGSKIIQKASLLDTKITKKYD